MDQELADSAARTFAQAPRTCSADCAWYHGLWQYLRLLGLASTPLDDAAFFEQELGTLASGARVLIAGTADYAPLELIARSAPHAQVTVLDRCATPLALCADYARRHGLAVTTVCADVRTWRPDPPLDAVFTHGLLARFPAAQREEVISAWHDCLRPGGRAWLVTRLDPDRAAQGAAFAAPQDFARAIEAAFTAHGIPDPGIGPAATHYAARFSRHAPLDLGALEQALGSGGLRVTRRAVVSRRTTPGLDGPGDQYRQYAQIVAVRP